MNTKERMFSGSDKRCEGILSCKIWTLYWQGENFPMSNTAVVFIKVKHNKNDRNIAWISQILHGINNTLGIFNSPKGLSNQIKIG